MAPGNKKTAAAPTLFIGFAGGSAGVAELALAPWLCDAIFRWLCSEQRTYSDALVLLLLTALGHVGPYQQTRQEQCQSLNLPPQRGLGSTEILAQFDS